MALVSDTWEEKVINTWHYKVLQEEADDKRKLMTDLY